MMVWGTLKGQSVRLLQTDLPLAHSLHTPPPNECPSRQDAFALLKPIYQLMKEFSQPPCSIPLLTRTNFLLS